MPKATIQRKLFAASGVAPLGGFVAVHLLTTATGLGGEARFGRMFAHRAWTSAALILLVLLPLAFHAGYGVYLAAHPAAKALPSWQAKLRRTAALATLAFVVAHVIELPARVWIGGIEAGALFDVVSAHLSSTWHGVPVVAVFYLTGVAATLAHLGLELWVFVPTQGVILAAGARKALAWGLVAGTSALFVLAGDSIVFFATGLRLFGPSPPAFVPEGPPPVACSPNAPASPKN